MRADTDIQEGPQGQSQPEPGLSVAIITLNEEKNLPRALRSVPFADEVVMVDSGSTDGTVALARDHGARVIQRPWPGYGQQKNFALEQARCEWVLSLDADEALSPELSAEIRQVVSGERTGFDCYAMPRLSMFIDRWMRHGGWYPDRQIRLIRKGAAKFSERPVHERIETALPVGELQGDLLHYSYESISDYIRRHDVYSTLGARIRLESGRPGWTSVAGLAATLAAKFLEVYVWKRGFLDGRHGFIVACLAANSVFVRQCKIWEALRTPKQQD